MSQQGWNGSDRCDLVGRHRAQQAVEAILSDDHNAERGLAGVHEVTATVLAESGVDGLSGLAVELSLKLAEALERIAADQGLAAVDIADVLFVD
ncbi:hypothetical protein [Pseudonocardia pini]|uniref:hypothetical protein n=1 Tax=Pseudonocardia pini TaxID=2758030 RepID=UPI0015F09013|nr:hypothetical protein [Pseudonocardia pini]